MANQNPRDANFIPVIGAQSTLSRIELPITAIPLVGGSTPINGVTVAIVDQNGNQIGISTNPTSTKITDGTNISNVGASTDASNNFLLTGGAIQTDTFSTTSSGQGTSYPVSGFASVSVDVKTQLTSGAVQFQVSNDNTNWRAIALIQTNIGGFGTASTGNGQMWSGNLMGAKYFSINNTGSGGTAAGTIVFSTAPIVPPLIGASLNSNGSTGVAFGSPSNSDGNTANFSTLMVDTFPQLFNGTTWDRWKSTSTGIAGVNINDGTNSANILKSDGTAAGQNAQMIGGAIQSPTLISLSAGTQNSNWFDLSGYAWLSIEILTNTTPATLTFQTSGDASETNIRSTLLQESQLGTIAASTTSANGTYHGPRTGRYFRISSNLAGGNTATIQLTLYTMPSGLSSSVVAQTGTWTVGSNSATGSAVPANGFYQAGIDTSGNLQGRRFNITANLIATGTTSTQSNKIITTYNCRFLTILVNISAFTSGTLTVVISGVSTNYTYTLLSSAALAAQALTILTVGPGLPTTANISANLPLSPTVSVTATVSGGGSLTYGVDYVISD